MVLPKLSMYVLFRKSLDTSC